MPSPYGTRQAANGAGRSEFTRSPDVHRGAEAQAGGVAGQAGHIPGERAMHPGIAPAIAPYVDADRRRASLDAYRALMPHVESPLARGAGRIRRAARAVAAGVRPPSVGRPASRSAVADPC